jgi:tetratricopeptide (TPR) repeat protein
MVLTWSGPVRAQAASTEPGTGSNSPGHESFSRRLSLSHLERAREFERRADLAQALREYTESIALDSTLGEAYLRLGALRERLGDVREAELVYSQALRFADSNARALLQRSHLRRALGRSVQALTDLEASVELEASREALEELARLYVQAHAWSAALSTFRRIESSARESGDKAGLDSAALEVRALRVLAAETDPCAQRAPKHDWVGRALSHIARR